MKGRGELYAALIALIVSAPFVYVFAAAFADGATRAKEAPLRVMLGDDTFRALSEGQRTPVHYFGDDRLAPDFTLRDARGRPFSLRSQRGKVVLLNFWTVTCAPCLREMPTLDDLASQVAGRSDISIVAVTTDESSEEVDRVHREMTGTRFPALSHLSVVYDPGGAVVRGKYGTRLFPETWIIDPEGVIRFRFDGARDWSAPLVLELLESYL